MWLVILGTAAAGPCAPAGSETLRLSVDAEGLGPLVQPLGEFLHGLEVRRWLVTDRQGSVFRYAISADRELAVPVYEAGDLSVDLLIGTLTPCVLVEADETPRVASGRLRSVDRHGVDARLLWKGTPVHALSVLGYNRFTVSWSADPALSAQLENSVGTGEALQISGSGALEVVWSRLVDPRALVVRLPEADEAERAALLRALEALGSLGDEALHWGREQGWVVLSPAGKAR